MKKDTMDTEVVDKRVQPFHADRPSSETGLKEKRVSALIKRMIVVLGLVLLFVAAIGILKFMRIRAGIAQAAKSAPPPTAVTTTVAKKQRWEPVLSAVGSLRAVNGVTVSTDLAGIVSQISFQSGAPVKKGELLVKLDSQQEEAQLRSTEARRDLAKLSLERQRSLVASGAVAKSEFDAAESEFRRATAAVDEAKALIARKNITAPFDGLLGIRKVDLGQYLDVGAPIVPIQSVDPIYVEFALPQQNFEQIAVGKKLHIKADGIADEKFDGEITAIDSRLDEATRNVTIQGTIANPEGKLRTGMFVNVEVLLPEKEVISIPASSVSYAPYGDSVFVVKQGQVQQQFVRLGATRGDQVAINSGVKEGDEIVSSGVFKLRSGMPVVVNNNVQPGNEANPTPPNM